MSTEQQIIVIAGAILALVFEYAPKLREWYNAQSDGTQRQIMLGVLAVATGGLYGLSCTGYVNAVSCEGATDRIVFEALGAFVMAAMANQGIHRLTKRDAGG